jgi:hypothetical protein
VLGSHLDAAERALGLRHVTERESRISRIDLISGEGDAARTGGGRTDGGRRRRFLDRSRGGPPEGLGAALAVEPGHLATSVSVSGGKPAGDHATASVPRRAARCTPSERTLAIGRSRSCDSAAFRRSEPTTRHSGGSLVRRASSTAFRQEEPFRDDDVRAGSILLRRSGVRPASSQLPRKVLVSRAATHVKNERIRAARLDLARAGALNSGSIRARGTIIRVLTRNPFPVPAARFLHTDAVSATDDARS